MSHLKWKPLALVVACGLVGCLRTPQPNVAPDGDRHEIGPVPVAPGQVASRELRPVLPAPVRTYGIQAAANATTDMRYLVVSGDGTEPSLELIKGALDYLGMPYDVWVASQRPGQLTPDKLANGSHGHYQAVILTNSDLGHEANGAWTSALSQAEWDTLTAYEGAFGTRQVTWYSYADAEHGFVAPDLKGYIDGSGLTARYTAAGAAVFPYLATAGMLKIHDLFVFQAQAAADATPLLTDAAGHALAATKTYPDGHEGLAFTFDANAWSDTSWALAYGALRWAAGGVLLGERQATFAPEADDLFLTTLVYGSQAPVRIGKADLDALDAWFTIRRKHAASANTMLALAYNAGGVTDPATDGLYAEAMQLKSRFQWISHTLTHPNLDTADYPSAQLEIASNGQWGATQALPGLDPRNLITPQISGLQNTQAMNAAYDCGVRFVVGDIYKPGLGNPTPNAGLMAPGNPKILVIPRVTSNMYWDVSTPQELMAEYNDRNRSRWGRDLTYAEIIDKESELQLLYLLKGDADPWMFHQANLKAYDGTHSLFSDLMDATLDRYEALAGAPLQSPPMERQAERMLARMAYNQGGVTATLARGRSITLHANQACSVPITGLGGPGAKSYAGDVITTVPLAAGQTLTLALDGNNSLPTATPAPTATPTATPAPTATPTPGPTPTSTPASTTLDPSVVPELSQWWQGLTRRQRSLLYFYWICISESDRQQWIQDARNARSKEVKKVLDKLLAAAKAR